MFNLFLTGTAQPLHGQLVGRSDSRQPRSEQLREVERGGNLHVFHLAASCAPEMLVLRNTAVEPSGSIAGIDNPHSPRFAELHEVAVDRP